MHSISSTLRCLIDLLVSVGNISGRSKFPQEMNPPLCLVKSALYLEERTTMRNNKCGIHIYTSGYIFFFISAETVAFLSPVKSGTLLTSSLVVVVWIGRWCIYSRSSIFSETSSKAVANKYVLFHDRILNISSTFNKAKKSE
jgi:hypothetical protein